MTRRGPNSSSSGSSAFATRRVPLFVGLSIAGHVVFYLVVSLTGLGRGCGAVPTDAAFQGSEPSGVDPDQDDLLCLADELLATGAHALACFGPGGDRPDACASEALARLEVTRYACREARPIDVTMIEPIILNPFAERPTEEQQQVEMVEKHEEAVKPEEKPDQTGQVVDVAKPAVEVRPDDSEFLSEYDSKVEKQTKAPNAGEAARPPPPPPTPPPREQQPPAQKKGAGALAMRSSDGSGSKVDDEQKQPGGQPEGRPVEDKDGVGPRAGDGNKARATAPAESPGAGNGQPLPSMSDLRPSEEQIQRAVGGAGSIDSLKDIDDGATTQLNTKRFKYASFFNRVKHAVAQQWHPDDAYRLRDPTGQIYGIKSRRTIIRVALKGDGTVRDLLLEHPCGVDFLDDEALKALREAAPFPNPPQGLVDKSSGLITFRFEFNFEVYDAPTFKVFRYH